MWKTVPEVVFRFSYWGWQQEKRKTRSFFVFLTAVRSKKNELTVYTRTGKTKYGIRFHLLLMYHVILRMRNANFVNRYGDFGPPQYLWNGLT